LLKTKCTLNIFCLFRIITSVLFSTVGVSLYVTVGFQWFPFGNPILLGLSFSICLFFTTMLSHWNSQCASSRTVIPFSASFHNFNHTPLAKNIYVYSCCLFHDMKSENLVLWRKKAILSLSDKFHVQLINPLVSYSISQMQLLIRLVQVQFSKTPFFKQLFGSFHKFNIQTQILLCLSNQGVNSLL